MERQDSSKQILISAFIGSNNLGDEAIFKSILDNIESKNEDITALSVNEEKTREFGVNTLYSRSIKDNLTGIRNCDIMLIGGGGIIQDQSSILNFLYYAFQLRIAKHYRKPVVFCFVGVGPLKFGISKWLMKRLVSIIDYAIVRDEKSKNELLKHGMKESKIHQAHDPALNFSFETKKIESPYAKEKPYVAVSLRRWFFTNPFLPVFITRKFSKFKTFHKKYDQHMAKLAADLDKYLNKNKNVKLVLVSFYDGEDDVVNDDLLALMKNKKRVIVAEKNMNELQYLSIVKDASFIIGMRLHSLILGSTLFKPFVALRYSSKVDEFTDQLGLTKYSIHVEDYSKGDLLRGLHMIEEDIGGLEWNVRLKVDKYKANNQKAFKLLNEKIDSL